MVKYMHTLNGMPAMYFEGDQICYASNRYVIQLRNSLDEIKADRRKSAKCRKSMGLGIDTLEMGHIRIKF
jgi:hypothetical protein